MKQRELKDWNDITFNEFLKLKDIAEAEEMSDDMKSLEMVLLLYGNVPITDMCKYVQNINNILVQPMPSGDTIASTLTVNGHKYMVTKEIEKITTSQFIDYSNYCKDGGKFEDLLSCFIIPDGHKYDDGYDMEETKKDIGDLSVVTVQRYCFFFRKKWLRLQKISLLSLMVETFKLKGMSWKNKWKMASAQATLLINMAFLTSYSQSSKNQD